MHIWLSVNTGWQIKFWYKLQELLNTFIYMDYLIEIIF